MPSTIPHVNIQVIHKVIVDNVDKKYVIGLKGIETHNSH